MPENEEGKERPMGATEELIAKAQAEAEARRKQTQAENPHQGSAQEISDAQEQERLRREQAEQEQREWEAKRDGQGQAQGDHSSETLKNEGTNTHRSSLANATTPGKEQHQQILGQEMGSGGTEKIITQRAYLGVTADLTGLYVVPRYETRIREVSKGSSSEDRVSYMRQLAKDQSSGWPQGKGQEKANAKENTRTPEQDKGKDRDRGMER